MYSSFNVILVPSSWVFAEPSSHQHLTTSQVTSLSLLAPSEGGSRCGLRGKDGAFAQGCEMVVNLEVALGCPCYVVNRSKWTITPFCQ